MDNSFRLVVAQLNPKAGDLEGNAKKVRLAFQEAKEMNANLVAFPEMFLIGYQVGDLVRKPAFVTEVMKLVDILALEFEFGPSVGLGAPYWDGKKLFNAYYILANGKIETIIKKHFLPNDNEFDEKRYFRKDQFRVHIMLMVFVLALLFVKTHGIRMYVKLRLRVGQKYLLCLMARHIGETRERNGSKQ